MFPDSRPIRYHLDILHKELNTNTMVILSSRGDPALGHLALVTSASHKIFFDPSLNPGHQPSVPNPNTPTTRTEASRQWLADKKKFDVYTNTEAYLKNQILAAVPATYVNLLRQPRTGFACVASLALLQHLDEIYGTVTQDDLALNAAKLDREWTATMPLEALFFNVRACHFFCGAPRPYFRCSHRSCRHQAIR